MKWRNIFSHIPSYTLIYPHIHSYTLIYPHIPSYTLIYPHIPSYTLIYLHIPSYVPHIPSYTLIYSHIPFVAKKLVPGQNVAPKSWYRDKMSRLKVGTGTKCRAYEHPRAPSKQTSSATYCPGTIYVLGQNVAGQNVSWPQKSDILSEIQQIVSDCVLRIITFPS